MRPNHVKVLRHGHVHFHAENSGSGLDRMPAILFPEGNNLLGSGLQNPQEEDCQYY